MYNVHCNAFLSSVSFMLPMSFKCYYSHVLGIGKARDCDLWLTVSTNLLPHFSCRIASFPFLQGNIPLVEWKWVGGCTREMDREKGSKSLSSLLTCYMKERWAAWIYWLILCAPRPDMAYRWTSSHEGRSTVMSYDYHIWPYGTQMMLYSQAKLCIRFSESCV